MATILSEATLLQVGPYPTQVLFYIAWERITAQYLPATNSELGRELGVPHSTRIMQDVSYLNKAIEAIESRVLGWAASFSWVQCKGIYADMYSDMAICHSTLLGSILW